ncbi:MBL fold metallo-hydrolase [Herpetosiphon llansteffanensis]|uniref:MBL fold metallo-hydrolase n=1 Tax=Herpetosiphon llansteffanensis TaxID=2094568 RepID=UPI000D7BBF80|nr:MBL fold metallo-hydrolase [Herpetosiphon llansteffanensis]
MPFGILNVGYDSTNYYLVGSTFGFLLIDAGWPGTWGKLMAVLKRNDVDLDQIHSMLITHYHPDHAGLVQELKAKGIELIVVEEQQPAIPLLKSLIKPEHNYQPITADNTRVISTAQSREWLASLAMAGEIIHTPGHSADSISLVLDQGIAFTGDLQPYAADDEGQASVERSFQALRERGVEWMYPGHGPMRPLIYVSQQVKLCPDDPS